MNGLHFLFLLVMTGMVCCSMLGATTKTQVPWVIGPHSNGRLPEWKIGPESSCVLKMESEINRDWSGYRRFEVQVVGGKAARIQVILTNSDGKEWIQESKIHSDDELVKFPFDQFKIKPNETGVPLDLALLKKAEILVFSEEKNTDRLNLKQIQLADSKGFYGPGVNVDVVFKHYHSKPFPEIAQEIKNKGFTSIHVIDVNLQPEGFQNLAKTANTLHHAGLNTVLTVYPTTDHVAYAQHPEWRQRSLNGSSSYDWRTYLCPNNPEFSSFMEEKIGKALRVADFDALEFAEPWFEIWGGPEELNVGGYYCCVCDHCRQKFKALSGVDPLGLFDPKGPHYFRKNPDLYEKWIKFRVDSLQSFMLRLYKAAEKARPGIGRVAMLVSDCRVEPGKSREYQGQDFDSIIKDVKPDAMVIESAWQDWTQSGLESVYIADYGKAYIPRRGSVKLLSQCDIGSTQDAKRGIEWLRSFSSISAYAGFEGYVAYEYSIGKDTTGP